MENKNLPKWETLRFFPFQHKYILYTNSILRLIIEIWILPLYHFKVLNHNAIESAPQLSLANAPTLNVIQQGMIYIY